jgi:hypothetical protein
MVRRIDLNDGDAPDRITMLVAGASRSGKTHFAGTFPRPYFLSDATEGGHRTLQHMYDEDFYEPSVRPVVYEIASASDMMEGIVDIENEWKKDPSQVGTIVVDSLTFYAELKFSELEVGPDARDKRKLYGDLASHLRYIMIRVHKLPVNVVWLSLAKEGGEDHALGGVSIPGQTAHKAPARCDIWAYLEQRDRRVKGQVEREFKMHFQTYAGFRAGHRFGDMLPPALENATYKQIEELLDLPPWLEKFQPKPTTKKKAAAK